MIDLTPYTNDKEILFRFLSKVNFCDHGIRCKKCCWLWKGAVFKFGLSYGHFHVCYISQNPRKAIEVHSHRFMWYVRKGHTDLDICHTCDIPLCCNIHHLFSGTAKENAQDRQAKDRGNTPKGEKHYNSKLNESAIQQIFLLKGSFSYNVIGSLVGVSSGQVSRILNRQQWKHLEQ